MTTIDLPEASRLRAIAKDAASVEYRMKYVLMNAQSAERDLDSMCHTLDSLVTPETNSRWKEHEALLTEARAALVTVRTLRRLIAPEFGVVGENALAAERAAAGIPTPEF